MGLITNLLKIKVPLRISCSQTNKTNELNFLRNRKPESDVKIGITFVCVDLVFLIWHYHFKILFR